MDKLKAFRRSSPLVLGMLVAALALGTTTGSAVPPVPVETCGDANLPETNPGSQT